MSPEAVVGIAIVGLLGWLALKAWARSRAMEQASSLAQDVFPVWAQLGPFTDGWHSADAMRAAWIVTANSPPDPDQLKQHAQAYDLDPASWESNRTTALELAKESDPRVPEARKILAGAAPPVGLTWILRRTRSGSTASNQLFSRLSGGHRVEEFLELIPEALAGWRKRNVLPESGREGRFNPYLFDEAAWIDDFSEKVHSALSSQPGEAQKLGLRAMVVDATSDIAVSEFFLSDQVADEDVVLAAAGFIEGEATASDVLSSMSETWQSAQLTLACSRHMAGVKFSDASEHDYLKLLQRSASMYYENALGLKLARAKSEIFVFEAMVPVVEQTYRNACETVLQGGNFDSQGLEDADDEDDIEEEPDLPTVDVVDALQIDELFSIISDRVERLAEGTLYRTGDFRPVDAATVVRVDSGLMLIGLSECITTAAESERVVTEVLRRFLRSLDLSEAERATVESEEVVLDEQRALLEMWREAEEEGPLAGVALVVAAMVFGVDPERYGEASPEDREAFGRVAFEVLDDIYEVIRRTRAVFGHEDPGPMLSDD